MADIYKVRLGGDLIGFFPALKWSEASRAGASQHQKATGETIPWEHFSSYWVNPKHYEAEGVPEELYREEEAVS